MQLTLTTSGLDQSRFRVVAPSRVEAVQRCNLSGGSNRRPRTNHKDDTHVFQFSAFGVFTG